MSIRNAALLLGLGLLLLPACGSSGTDPVVSQPLNSHEKLLLGTYELRDFAIYEAGVAPYEPAGFETWEGLLELRDDRTGFVTLELCENAGTPTATCDRDVIWEADSGLLHLYCVDPNEPDVALEWDLEGMGRIRTDVVVPTNAPDCGYLLVEDGRESFRWLRLE